MQNIENIGELNERILAEYPFLNWDSTSVDFCRPSTKVLVFASLYCIVCVDIMPYLKDIDNTFSHEFMLFCNGSIEDHKEMAEYFQWDFPVIQLYEPQMEALFGVSVTPSLLVVDGSGNIISRTIVKKSEEINQVLKSVTVKVKNS